MLKKLFTAIFNHSSILILSIILTLRSCSQSKYGLCVLKRYTYWVALADVLCNVEITDLENMWVLCTFVCR